MDAVRYSRRRFVSGAGAGVAVAVLAPHTLGEAFAAARRSAVIRGGRFAEGVASGDPGPTAITLWTRLHDVARSGQVMLEVARDRGFDRVVAREAIATSGPIGHSVKARIRGLEPHERYFYRFETATAQSPVGRFQTALPPDSNETVRLAFFSCQDFAHGFYNAHALMAREDVDFVVNLGDYIYEAPQGGPSTRVRRDPSGTARTLDDYRRKYRVYRSDASLRALHSLLPFVSTWDDHEVEDNYAGGDPTSEDYNPRRRSAGYRAWFESMPTYAVPSGRGTRLYRSLRFGNAVELIMLDERQYRDNQPCGDVPGGPDCSERQNPRDFLGAKQLAFLKQRLAGSRAAWKLIGNEVLMAPAKIGQDRFATFDTWQGYPREREEVLRFIRSRGIEDVVFLTGDLHTFAAADVRTKEGTGELVATEFHSGSITSTNFGEGAFGLNPAANDANPNTPKGIYDFFLSSNPWADYIDLDHHGYGIVAASRRSLKVTFRRLRTIKRRTTATLPDKSWTLSRGQRSLKRS